MRLRRAGGDARHGLAPPAPRRPAACPSRSSASAWKRDLLPRLDTQPSVLMPATTPAGHRVAGAAQRLHLAVGVGVAGLDQQLARPRHGRQGLDRRACRAPLLVERQRQLVGDQRGRRCAAVSSSSSFAAGSRLAARRLEAEALEAGKLRHLRAQQRRHPHRQVAPRRRRPGSSPAPPAAHARRATSGLALGADAALEHRQAELLDAELAAGTAAAPVAARLRSSTS